MVQVEKFITNVSQITGAPVDYLIQIWKNANEKVKMDQEMKERKMKERKTKKKVMTADEKRRHKYKMEEYRDNMSYTLAEMKDLCRREGLKTSGSKDVLKQRLITGEGKVVKPKGDIGGYTFSSLSSKIMGEKNRSLIAKIKDGGVKFKISLNTHGNYMNKETRIVVDSTTQVAIGVQNDDGTIQQLFPEDIEVCRKYDLDYDVGENLHQSIEEAVKDKVEVLTKDDYEDVDELSDI